MKVIVGVDLAGMHEPALRLGLALEFPHPQFLLVHSVEPVPVYAPPLAEPTFDTFEWIAHLREAGKAALKTAEAVVASQGVAVRSLLVDGPGAANLISTADQEGSDLIIVGSSASGALAGILLGSVARALTVGAKQSFLVTKKGNTEGEAGHALFAFDGSKYSHRCFEKLLAWAPSGLKRIDVVRAFDTDNPLSRWLDLRYEEEVNPGRTLKIEGLERESEAIADRLRGAGFHSHVFAREGHPAQVLPEVMQETGAQLMIVGAQGHGFLERVFIGSISLRQVMSEPYPVLVLRVP